MGKQKKQPRPQRENLNPESHPHVQALIDLEKVGFNVHEILVALTDNSDEMREIRSRLQQVWNSHTYPDKSIRFVMSNTYNRCPQRFALSLEAQAVLGLMERLQSQKDGAVAVKKKIFATALHFSKGQTEKFQKYLNELEVAGFIECVSMPPQGSHSPAVYTVNRDVSWLGTRQRSRAMPNVSVPGFKQLYEQVTEEIILPNGERLRCGTLGEWQERPTKDRDSDAIGIAENTPE